jgi:very-short-patch-repair endonuclease
MAIKIKRGYMKLKIICEYCKQEFNSKKSCYKHKHEIHHIKNGQAPKYDLICKFCGYTNYITKAGMTLHEKYCKLNPDKIICIGHPVSDATKNKISNGMHIAALEGRNKGWTTSRLGENRKSYPEEFFTKVIENEFEDKNYQYNYPFYTWKLDFAWIDKKKCIEIDGSQHEEQKQKESDIRKDKKLIEEGWQVLRIKWKDLFNEPKKYINKANSFIVIDDQ